MPKRTENDVSLRDKIRLMGKQNIFGVTKLHRVGGSYVLPIPKIWVDLHCTSIDGDYYLRLEVEGGKLLLSPLELEDIDALQVRRKE